MKDHGQIPATRAPTARDIDALAADWIAARDGEHWDDDRQRALDAWLDESTLHRVAYLRLESAWRRSDRLAAGRRSQGTLEPPKTARVEGRHGRRLRWVAGLAAACLLATVGVLYYGAPFGTPGQMHATALGERSVISLADGSRITLNTASRIRVALEPAERKVWLDGGEAFFEVAHDKSRPFVIMAGGQTVTVVGTKFSLKREGDRLDAIVVEGKVRVASSSGATAILTAADTAEASADSLHVQHESVDRLTDQMSWIRGQLTLDGMTLGEAAAAFNRYNSRKIRILDASAANLRIGGVFDTDNIGGFTRLLQSGFGLTVREGRDEITVASAVAAPGPESFPRTVSKSAPADPRSL